MDGGDDYLLVPVVPGDMNCDGAVDGDDIPIFLTKLANFKGPPVSRVEPPCDWWAGDMNQDGTLSQADLGPFLALFASRPRP